MRNPIKTLLADGPYELAQGFDKLRDGAYALAKQDALRVASSVSTRYLLDEYQAFAPEGGQDDTLRAFEAVRAARKAEVDDDLAKLRRAIQEAEHRGFKAEQLYGDIPFSWGSGTAENSWKTGVLIEWRFRNSEIDLAVLEVELAGFSEVHIALCPPS